MNIDALAGVLLQARGPLALRVVDEMYADPFWTERYGARGRIHSEQDLAYHVEYLTQALVARDPNVLGNYARWLQSVLTTRGMCTHHLDESFVRLATAIGDRVADPAEVAEVNRYLAHAREALRYPSAHARALQDQAQALSDRVRAAAPIEIRGEQVIAVMSYLADAVALGSEKSLASYLAWMRSSLEGAGAGGELVSKLVETIDRALGGDPVLPPPARTLARELLARAVLARAA